jgi:hypothetical protein
MEGLGPIRGSGIIHSVTREAREEGKGWTNFVVLSVKLGYYKCAGAGRHRETAAGQGGGVPGDEEEPLEGGGGAPGEPGGGEQGEGRAPAHQEEAGGGRGRAGDRHGAG